MSSPLPPRRQHLPSAPGSPAPADAPPQAAAPQGGSLFRVADRRGLTAAGAVALGLGLGAAGGLYDVLTGPGLRSVFAVCFVLGSVLAAATVHREDLRAAVVMPPLVYVTLAFLGGAVEQAGEPGSFITQQGLELANALFVGAPVLVLATVLALLVAAVRGLHGRRRDHAPA